MVPSSFRVGLSTSIKSVQIFRHKNAQNFDSYVVLPPWTLLNITIVYVNTYWNSSLCLKFWPVVHVKSIFILYDKWDIIYFATLHSYGEDTLDVYSMFWMRVHMFLELWSIEEPENYRLCNSTASVSSVSFCNHKIIIKVWSIGIDLVTLY